MEAFAVLRAQKIDQGTETAAHNHNLRASSTKTEKNIDRSLTHLNQLLLGSRKTINAINAIIENETDGATIRKDANRAIEFVLSASPEHFYDFEKAGITREQWDELKPSNYKDDMGTYWQKVNQVKKHIRPGALEAWQKNATSWAQESFGKNIANLVLHMDEKTPHMHLIVVPIVKNKLTAKQFFTPANSAKWQASYAKKTGLKKGISSEKKHETAEAHELVQAGKRGYRKGYKVGKEAGYKAGKEAGYKAGKAEGLAQASSVGEKVGAVITGWGKSWHKPSKQAQAEIAKATARAEAAEKEKKKVQEAAKSAADNRVARAAEREQFERDRANGLARDLDRTESQLTEALSYLTPAQREKVSNKFGA